jgi:nitrate/TMAO reductase-like tetraheme cytochrome c subunit
MRKWIRRHWKFSILVIILLFSSCSYGLLEYTHNPRFCLSCHIMQPYYDAWASSSHKMVSCVECHYPPGLRYELQGKLDALNQVVAYWTGQYNTKFYAEISDESCLRSGCHDKRLIEGPIEFKRGIKFDHAGHYGSPMRGIELRCTSCHSQIVQGNHMAVTEVTCFLCHFKGRVNGIRPVGQKFCLECHDYPHQDIKIGAQVYNHRGYVERGVECQRCHLDAVKGNGEVEDRACLQCHADPEQLSKISDVPAVHLNHVTKHKVECFECHADILHQVKTNAAGISFDCAQCHTDTHRGPRELYSGTGGKGVPEMPAPMFKAQVDCVACHMDTTTYGAEHSMRGTTMRPTVQACVDCHGETGREALVAWQRELAAVLAQTEGPVGRARAALTAARTSHPGYAKAQQLVEDAEFDYDFVHASRGIHNLAYAEALLAKAREYAGQAEALLR